MLNHFHIRLQSEIDELKESLSSLNSKQSGEINKPTSQLQKKMGIFLHHQNPYHKAESDDQVDLSF